MAVIQLDVLCYSVSMDKPATQHVSLRCPVSLIEKLDSVAADERRSRGFVIIEILQQHFHQNGERMTPATKKARAR